MCGDDLGLDAVSGLALFEDILFVTDNDSGTIRALDLEGDVIDRLEFGLPSGALMGLAVRSLEEIWLVDAADDQVFRLTPAD